MTFTTPVGIDLGTTYSAVAYIDRSGTSAMIPNEKDELLTPSVVYFSQQKLTVGRDALGAATEAIGSVAENAKRDLGQPHYRHSIKGNQLPPEVVEACILRKLRKDAVKAIGEDFSAVITVPAYFDEPRRKATADAGTMSGIDVLDIVNEPTAAALAFGEKLGYLGPTGVPQEKLKLLVYDLGGGTFDVTVIELAPGSVTILATDGDAELGGLNWDAHLAEHIERRFRDLFPNVKELDDADRLRLERSAQQAKHELSTSALAIVHFEVAGNKMDLPVAREEFEDLTTDLLERTCFTTRQALHASGLLWEDIDRLLLVGGSSSMPMVRQALESLSGIVPDDTVHPKEAVARGAAIHAQSVMVSRGLSSVASSVRVKDVNSHSLGLEGINRETLRRENVTLIPRNTPLPYQIRRSFVTRKENQRSVDLQLLEGESSLPNQCSPLGRAAIRNLPPGLPEGTEIEIRYSFDLNGLLSVEASIPDVGEKAQIELRRIKGLTDDAVSRWQEVICKDGGYRDFEEAFAEQVTRIYQSESMHSSSDEWSQSTPDAPAAIQDERSRTLDPAVPFGAPQAASERLVQENREHEQEYTDRDPNRESNLNRGLDAPRTVFHARPPIWLRVSGFVLSSLAGLVVGYYVLCWLNPEANFLDLSLPGLPFRTTPD